MVNYPPNGLSLGVWHTPKTYILRIMTLQIKYSDNIIDFGIIICLITSISSHYICMFYRLLYLSSGFFFVLFCQSKIVIFSPHPILNGLSVKIRKSGPCTKLASPQHLSEPQEVFKTHRSVLATLLQDKCLQGEFLKVQ